MGQNEFLLKIRPDEKVRKTDTNHISGWSGSQDDSSWLLWRNILAAGRLAECTRSCETHKARTRWRRKSHWAQRESTVSHFHAGIFSSYWFRGLKERKKREQLMMELNGQTRGDLTEVDAGRWRRCCLIEFSRRFFLHPPAPSTKILSQDVAKCIPADPVADRWPNPTKIPIRMQKSFSNFQIFCRSMALHWNSIECPMKRTHCQLLWPLRVTETDRTGQMIKTTNATSAEVTFDVSSTGKSICRAPSLENSRAPFNCCIMSYLVSNESSLP